MKLVENLNPLVIEFLQLEQKGFESLSKALNNLNLNLNLNSNLNLNTNTNSDTSTSEEIAGDNIDLIESFESWWILYEKKGNRKTALERWLKLTQDERDKCFHVVTDYVKSTPDKQFRKDGQAYINQKAFHDEIVFPTSKQKQNLRTSESYNDNLDIDI